MYQALILDVGGVIFKEKSAVKNLLAPLLEGRARVSAKKLAENYDLYSTGMLTREGFWQNLGIENFSDIEKIFLDSFELNQGYYSFVESASRAYTLAILANFPSPWFKHLAKKFEFGKYFKSFTISGDVKVKKPDEKIFRLCLRSLGVLGEQCMLVDNDIANLEVAKKFNMGTVWFNPDNQKSVLFKPDFTIKSFKELELLI
jgi:putative hydrolase of the HAD superfamily